MKTCTSAVEVSHLRKTYGTLVAVDDVSVSVAEGQIFGILGPNEAGKTTAIECAIGLRPPDAGSVRLLGPARAGYRDRRPGQRGDPGAGRGRGERPGYAVLFGFLAMRFFRWE